MKELTVYDPAVADRSMDALTDQMITRINIHHDVVKIAKHIHRRESSLNRQISATKSQLRRERSKAKFRARRNGICGSAVLGAAAWFANTALVGGLTNINFTMPLALASAALLSWTACGWWHDVKKKRR